MKENKKEIRDSFITFPAGYYKKNLNIFSGNWPIACFCWNELKYHQRKVDLNTSQKSLVFFKIDINLIFMQSYRIRKFHICARICICGKMLLSYMFVWNRKMETKRHKCFLAFFHNFSEDKNSFYHTVCAKSNYSAWTSTDSNGK